MNKNQFLGSIAQTIQDYRKGEIQITPAHIDKWVKQFNVHDQITILSEVDHLHACSVKKSIAPSTSPA